MTIEDLVPAATHVFHYVVASADMYYSEEQQRDVLLGTDRRGRVRIWGAASEGDVSGRIELCQVFLEYAMYCCTWCGRDEALVHMQDFGEGLGHVLADYLKANPDLVSTEDPMLQALQQVVAAIGADCAEEHLESGVRFLVSHCRLEEVAQHSGLCHLELAHHGINALCRALILDMNPRSFVCSAPDTLPEFMFTVTAAAFA